jgi:hypothetical protein
LGLQKKVENIQSSYSFFTFAIDFHGSSLSSQPPFALLLIFNTIMADITLGMLFYNNSFAFAQYVSSQEW